ncbi:MAG TPA: transporter substrate-binding domain-containing protein [Cyclobacteriaceae bacterium]|nr:transporter substrate-binding domain-containing protein [Cyclobacteriaceae bacterium]HRJ81285.1 transporter substrate-binding domain-containing protein [Cyclobacteriaceae bacterium]
MQRSKKLVFSLVFIGALLSCNPFARHQPESEPLVAIDLNEIKERGFINALVDNNSFSYFIYKGRSMGYEYELLKLLADHLQVDLRIRVTSGIERAIEQLNKGEGDILAFPLTVTKERTNKVSFTHPQFDSYQVLVQRKPENWRQLTRDQINAQLIRKPAQLIGKEIYVMPGSSFAQRLKHLSEEVGGEIIINQDSTNAETENLIRAVAMGEIEYTVTDNIIARVNAAYYNNLDVETIISLPQTIAWAVRKNSPGLEGAVNEWLAMVKKEPTFMVIFNRYFNSPRTSIIRLTSDYSSLAGNKISPFDELIKEGANELGWDWRLLAAVIYQESRFDPQGESWAGAKGLMQLMPETAKRFGVNDPDNPRQSLRGGVRFLKHLDKYWSKDIQDQDERLKFVLASYNAGLTHIIDARKLAEKYGEDPTSWAIVESYLLKKSDSKYYRDPVVMAGYCKCEEPVNYIKAILSRYEEYKLLITA